MDEVTRLDPLTILDLVDNYLETKKLTLSIRQEFAKAAMQGMLSATVVPIEGIENKLAKAACKYADALIAELAKPCSSTSS